MTTRPFLIWSDQDRGWWRGKGGFSEQLADAGVFRELVVVDPDRARRVPRTEALVLLVKRRAQLHAELRRLNDVEAGLLGIPLDRLTEGVVRPSTSRDVTLATALSELDLSVRLSNCLHEAGLRTVGDVSEKSPYDLASIPNLGPLSYRELVDRMRALGVEIGGDI